MKIKQIEILSNDLIETEEFYAGKLGLNIKDKTDLKISFIVGESVLIFLKTDIKKPVYHFAFNIPNNQLAEAEQWLLQRTSIIQYENKNVIDFQNWNAKSLYFLDNNGNVLEFIVRFDLENSSPKTFRSSGILSISEMALVTNDVEELATKLINENKFSYFDKQIQGKNFSVLGEDEGLLILVDSERNWFPTDIRSEKFPVKLLIDANNNLTELEYK
ncbi:MAG: glyoxalase [Bacteroidia bacterium]